MAASASVEYNVEGGRERIQTMIADISLSGIGVYSDKPISEGTVLSIEITFISTEGLMTTSSMQGESVYVRKIGDMFFTGIEFDEEIDAVTQPSLHEHLQKILSWD